MPKRRLEKALVPPDRIERSTFVVRGRRVRLDSDLARVDGVLTHRLNEQVRRNAPEDFVFQLTAKELADLISQFARSSGGHGGASMPGEAKRTTRRICPDEWVVMTSGRKV